jgi:ribonuclease HII
MDKPIICGIDEVGRGAIAGPIVAAALTLPYTINTIGTYAKSPIRDSKTLSKLQRERIFLAFEHFNIGYSIAQIDVQEINKNGIGWANRELFRMLIEKTQADTYILDGNIKPEKIGVTKKTTIISLVDADATVPEVICAGIVAKVYRDRFMQKLHEEFPTYGFLKNAGYGTKEHTQSIRQYGVTPWHRSVFVRSLLKNAGF